MKRKFRSVKFICAGVLVLLVLGAGPAGATGDQRNDNPDYLYYIEGTGSYFLPGSDGDIFFNLGRWYKHTGDSWYTSDRYKGPWEGVPKGSLPADLANLPPDFRATRHLGMIPSRYVLGEKERDEKQWQHYYWHWYYKDYKHRGYERRWHRQGKFWFFVAPDFHDD